MRKIEGYQIRKIHAIGHALGIVDPGEAEDELHALVRGITGKDSIRELTYREAGAVLARLEGLQKAPPKRKGGKQKEHGSRPGGITSGQQKKVWALMYRLKACDREPGGAGLGDRLCGIIRKELGVDALAKDPFAWVTFAQGNDLIEMLKRYVANAERKGGVAGNGIKAGRAQRGAEADCGDHRHGGVPEADQKVRRDAHLCGQGGGKLAAQEAGRADPGRV